MKRNPELQTPWSGGNLMHHPSAGGSLEPEEWRGNDEFKATLKLLGTERGRSAAFFRWEVVDGDLPKGTLLPMFITDVGHVLMNGLAEPGGIATGRWFVVKRGQNYGVTPMSDQEQPTEATGAPSGS